MKCRSNGPYTNGQGKTKEEAVEDLKAAILLILEDRREDAKRGLPDTAICEPLPLV